MSKCFGRLYDVTTSECQSLCDVEKECKMVMEGRIKESKSLPCFGTYEEENWACSSACHKKEECKAETIRFGDMSEEEKKEAIASNGADVEPIDEKDAVTIEELKKTIEGLEEKETELDAETLEEVEDEAAETEEIVQKPVRVAQTKAGISKPSKVVAGPKKPVKKDIVRGLMFTDSGATMDEMLDAIFASGAEDDTPENRKKNRSLINSWCSEFKRNGMTIDRKGDTYVGTRN